MASGSSNYKRGEMDVQAQSGAFGGFMELTKYGGAAVALVVLMPVLVYGTNMAWFPALIATFVFGIIVGVVLKFKGFYYGALFASAVLTAIICFLLSLLGS